MPRPDLSNYLVHWVKGDTYSDSFDILCKIVMEGRLLGGNGMIKGGFKCVCFTESPQQAFHKVLGKYKPFGIQVSKKWLFIEGGLPVIYQPLDKYDLLPESHKWRHMTYDLAHRPEPIDFSWEREWRIKIDELPLPVDAKILIPEQSWGDKLEERYYDDQEKRNILESLYAGSEWFNPDDEPFRYEIEIINFDE